MLLSSPLIFQSMIKALLDDEKKYKYIDFMFIFIYTDFEE